MSKFRTIILIWCLFGSGTSMLFGQTMNLNWKDGTSSQYLLNIIQSLKFSGTIMTITKKDATTTPKSLVDFRQITFSNLITSVLKVHNGITNTSHVYPNPCVENISIDFELDSSCSIEIEIYDINGRLIKKMNIEKQGEVSFIFQWDLRDNSGNKVENGNYFCRIISIEGIETKKILVIK
jgi:hypothetical protein